MTAAHEIRSLADRYCDSFEQGNIEDFRECHSPEATIWHNHDDREQSRDANVAATREFFKLITNIVIAKRRVHVFDRGFVHQHELQGVRANGVEVRLPLCIVCQVKNGKIVRRDEYLDSACFSQFV